jgi:peptide/nickel transport system substrate-binding protein
MTHPLAPHDPTRREALRVAGGTLAAVGLAGPAAVGAATPSDALVIAREISSIAEWDPAVSQILDTQEINGDIYDRLVGFDPRKPGGELGPMIAESWTVTPDGTQFVFRIRRGVRFHSGNTLTANDVAYTFKRVVSLDREPATNLLQIGITRDSVDTAVRAMDDTTLVLTLPDSYATSYILGLLSSNYLGIVDSKLLQANEQGGDFGSRWLSRRTGQETSAGSGPFRIATYRASDVVVLERHDAYWRFKPPLRRVIFRHVPESGAQRLLLERGDADMAFNLTTQDIEALKGRTGVKVESFPSRRVLYFGFNMLNKPFDDARVRRAMKHLIDYEGFEATLMKGLGTVHQTFIPSGNLGASKERPFRYDVARARALLAEAGLQQGFSFRLHVANRRPESDMATAFQASAAQAGVKVDVITTPPSQLIPMYRERKTEALILSFFGPYGDPHATANKFAFNPGALPGADRNKPYPAELTWRLGWFPTELSKQVIAASRESDPKKRAAMYTAIQKTYWEESPFAQMFQAIQAIGMRTGVTDYRYGNRGADTSFSFTSKR